MRIRGKKRGINERVFIYVCIIMTRVLYGMKKERRRMDPEKEKWEG